MNKLVLEISLFISACVFCVISGSAAQLQDFELVPQVGHGNPGTRTMALSPDNRFIASGGENVKLWDLNGKLLKTLTLNERIHEINFSQDSKTLSIISCNSYGTACTLRVWDPATNQNRSVPIVFIPPVGNSSEFKDLLSFSPDGGTLAVAAMDGVRLLDAKTLKETGILASGTAQQAVSFTPDGTRIISVSGGVKIWDAKTHKLLDKFPTSLSGISGLRVHPSGRIFALSDPLKGTELRDLNGNMLGTIKDCVNGAFNPNGEKIFASIRGNAQVSCVYRITPENKIEEVETPARSMRDIAFGNDLKTLYYIQGLDIEKFDLETGAKHKLFRLAPHEIETVQIQPNSPVLVASVHAGLSNPHVQVWDLDSLYLKDYLFFYRDRMEPGEDVTRNHGEAKLMKPDAFTFSKDGKKAVCRFSLSSPIISSLTDYYARYILDPEKWTIVRKLESVREPPKQPGKLISSIDFSQKFEFTPDGESIIGLVSSTTLGIWRLEDGKLLSEFATNPTFIKDFSVSPDGRSVATSCLDRIRVWDISSGGLVSSFVPYKPGKASVYGNLRGVIFAKDGSIITSADHDFWYRHDVSNKGLVQWSIKGVELKHLSGEEELNSLLFNPLPKLMVRNKGSYVELWNPRNKQAVLLMARGKEWLVATPDGYFDASPHGGELVAVVKDLKAYSIDQFAARNNRPDLILERMGAGSPEQISHLYMQYQKRLRKLGLTEADLNSDFNTPVVKILNTKTEGKFAFIKFSVYDKKYPLKRYNIYVNDTPIYGPYGKELGVKTYRGDEKIELTAGRNKIELTAINQAGAESFRALIYAQYKGAEDGFKSYFNGSRKFTDVVYTAEKGELYYLAFGVSKYKEHSLNLNYADKDAKDLEAVVANMRPAYSKLHIKTLVNSEVTAENIKKAKDFLSGSKIDDTVIIFVAGHGGYDKGKDPQYYYLPHEANPNDLTATGVNFDTLEGLLSDILPRKKLLLIDTCESGELDDDIYSDYFALAEARGIKPRGSWTVIKGRGDSISKKRRYLYQKNRYIHNNLARRTGAIVFSSSRGGEMSYESPLIKNGFFTKEVMAAFTSRDTDKNHNGKVDAHELRDFVAEAVARDTGNLQHPTIDIDNLFQTIEFPLITQ